MPVSKTDQAVFADQVISEILSGAESPLHVDMKLKAMEEVIKKIRKHEQVKAYTIEEAEKYGKTFMLHGVEITVSRRTTKDYSGCDDILDDLYSDLEKLNKQIKAREATIDSGLDPSTGVTFSNVKTSTTTYLTYKFK
jgi:hypothetical protein